MDGRIGNHRDLGRDHHRRGPGVGSAVQVPHSYLGPFGLSDYERLLPGGVSLALVVAVVRNYIGDQLSWDLNPILKREEIPPIRLDGTGLLGWTTWLTSRPPERDGDELLLNAVAWSGETRAS